MISDVDSRQACFGVPGITPKISEGCGAGLELPPPAPDGRIYLSTKQAAQLFQVKPCTISAWKSRGYLFPLAGSPARKPLYLWEDLVKAEFTAWQNALRTSGSGKRVKRRPEGNAGEPGSGPAI